MELTDLQKLQILGMITMLQVESENDKEKYLNTKQMLKLALVLEELERDESHAEKSLNDLAQKLYNDVVEQS